MTTRYLTPREVAEMLRVSVKTIAFWRQNGGGPPYVELSRKHVRYEETAVVSWARERAIDPRRR